MAAARSLSAAAPEAELKSRQGRDAINASAHDQRERRRPMIAIQIRVTGSLSKRCSGRRLRDSVRNTGIVTPREPRAPQAHFSIRPCFPNYPLILRARMGEEARRFLGAAAGPTGWPPGRERDRPCCAKVDTSAPSSWYEVVTSRNPRT